MKKILILMFVLSLTLSGCGKKAKQPSPSPSPSAPSPSATESASPSSSPSPTGSPELKESNEKQPTAKDLEKLINEANSTKDEEKRKELLAEIQAILEEAEKKSQQ